MTRYGTTMAILERKYHNNVLGGAVDEEDDQVTGAEEKVREQ